MKTFILTPQKGELIKKQKSLGFTPIAIQVGALPRKQESLKK